MKKAKKLLLTSAMLILSLVVAGAVFAAGKSEDVKEGEILRHEAVYLHGGWDTPTSFNPLGQAELPY